MSGATYTLVRTASLVTFGLLTVGACQKRIPEPERSPSLPATSASAESTPEPSASPVAVSASAAPAPPASALPKVTKLQKEDIAQGKGKAVKSGDRVKVHYTGRLLDDTKFDSSLDRGDPFVFTVGAGEVIKGWDEGLVGMKKGGKRRLTIPSDMAYGKPGRPPTIGPDAPLKFEIELLEIL